MLNKISIKSRMIVFILLTIAIFSIVGVLSQLTLKQDAITNEKTSDDLRIITASANVNYITNQQYTQLLL